MATLEKAEELLEQLRGASYDAATRDLQVGAGRQGLGVARCAGGSLRWLVARAGVGFGQVAMGLSHHAPYKARSAKLRHAHTPG